MVAWPIKRRSRCSHVIITTAAPIGTIAASPRSHVAVSNDVPIQKGTPLRSASRTLGEKLLEGDWVLAAFDVTAFAIGAFFGVLALSIQRNQNSVVESRAGNTTKLPKPATG